MALLYFWSDGLSVRGRNLPRQIKFPKRLSLQAAWYLDVDPKRALPAQHANLHELFGLPPRAVDSIVDRLDDYRWADLLHEQR